MDEIRGFEGQYRFLSNFWVGKPIIVAGMEWMTAEHLYQALKTSVPEEIERVRTAPTPGKAKFYGRGVTLRKPWTMVDRTAAMKFVVGQKFLQDPELAKALMGTQGALLVEGNTWHDNFFGDCSCEACADEYGWNRLGALLMTLRTDLLTWSDLSWMDR